ncbi:nucleolar protein 4, partial [Phenoliferia sp. Uapishka_3]
MPAPKRYFDKTSSPDKKSFKERDDRELKEKFKPKTGFIAAGLKQYTEAAEASALAKKEQLAEGWTDRTTTQTTLHLTHLPPTLSSPQLSILCSSYAPLRSAFVVSTSNANPSGAPSGTSNANTISTGPGRERTGKATSRGFGYVRFVLRTDADKCLEEWGSPTGIPRSAVKELEDAEGMEGVEWDKVCGRNGIKMAWAKKKLKEGEEPEVKPKTKIAKPEREKKEKVETVVREKREWIDYDAEGAPPRPAHAFDHASSRTVIIQGIPIPLTAEEKAAKKAKKEADAAARMEVDGDDEEKAAEEPEEADEEVDAETGKPVDWKKALKQKAKKIGELEDVQWPVLLASGESVGIIVLPTPRLAHELMKKLHNHVFRGHVISAAVKSSWDLVQRLGRGKGGGRLMISVADLRTVFAKYGSLHSITLPLDGTTGLPRGFAFVYYLSKSAAEAALKGVNETRIYAGLAAERVMSEGGKGGKKSEVRAQAKKDEKENAGGGGEKGRIVAVDWALGKDDYKKAQADEAKAAAEGESGSEGSEEEDEDSEEESEEEEEDDDSDLEPIAYKSEESEDEHHADDDDDKLDEEPEAPEPPKGTTLFVRNMSFEATEAELYDLFKAFGPVRYARIVYDQTTKRSRGTAFVCFWNDEDAQKVLQASNGLNAGLFGGEVSNKKDKTQSLLMADPSTSGASGLVLHGRVLGAVAAVSKDDADKLREDRDKQGAAKTDRRNLYLMREGVIFPSWAIAQTLHPADLAARQSSFDARKALLRSNPSLYISRTRLSVRQIPLYVSDGMMKRLANYAMKEFEKEVKLGHQKALTTEEKNNTVLDASGVVPPTKTERIKGVPPSRVRQAKILRQTDRVDPLTGLGRSKGYGFLELGSHADALRVLRWCNANKDVGALFRGWWRETLEKLIEKEESAEGPKKGKGTSAKDRAERAKRLKEKMAELVEEEENARGKAAKRTGKGKEVSSDRNAKCLIIEFSIENQITTKRRADKADRSRERAKRSKARNEGDSDSDSEDEGDDEAAASTEPTKKRKASEEESSTQKKVKVANAKKQELIDKEGGEAADEGKSKLWTGSIIGKKRRQKAGGKK